VRRGQLHRRMIFHLHVHARHIVALLLGSAIAAFGLRGRRILLSPYQRKHERKPEVNGNLTYPQM